jgi:hypothetical protein
MLASSTSTTFSGSSPCEALWAASTDEAKCAAGLFFEPVGDEAHAEALLHLEIAQVGGRDVGGRRIR